jgi:mono/diheme cytochrome c family protein
VGAPIDTGAKEKNVNEKALHMPAAGVVLGVLAFLVLASSAQGQDAGQKAFEANKCINCHSIEKLSMERKVQSEKMAGPDLSKVGDDHDAAWIVKFALREVEKDGKQHKSEYKGTKKDIEVIADWLAAMKCDS